MPAPGSRFANPALAATYQRILDEAEAAGADRDQQIEAARRAFYEGFVAEAIDGYLARAQVHGRDRATAPGAAARRRPGRLAGPARSSRSPSTSRA